MLSIGSNSGKFEAVVGMRQTRYGEMLLEVRGGESTVDAVKKAIKETTGESTTVRSIQQKGLIEIRDISCWTDKEDLIEALNMACRNGGDTAHNAICLGRERKVRFTLHGFDRTAKNRTATFC